VPLRSQRKRGKKKKRKKTPSRRKAQGRGWGGGGKGRIARLAQVREEERLARNQWLPGLAPEKEERGKRAQHLGVHAEKRKDFCKERVRFARKKGRGGESRFYFRKGGGGGREEESAMFACSQ